jgi:hypothetical protein
MRYLRFLALFIATLFSALVGLGIVIGLSFLIGPTYIPWIDVALSLLFIVGSTFVGYKLTNKIIISRF